MYKGWQSVFVEIEIDMANLSDAALGAVGGSILEGIHSQKNVRAGTVPLRKPGLEFGVGHGLGSRDVLHRLMAFAVAQQNRDMIPRLEECEHIF